MTTREPEWDDLDRAELEALAVIEADECPGCHGSLEETTDIKNDDGYTVRPVRCHRCTSIHSAQQRAAGDKTPFPQAVLWTAHLS